MERYTPFILSNEMLANSFSPLIAEGCFLFSKKCSGFIFLALRGVVVVYMMSPDSFVHCL